MYPQRSVMTCGLATALEPPHFNHAPVRGAIGASFSRRSRAGSFNPRTRVGCDQCVCVSCLQLHCVSIHAPAWGATILTSACHVLCLFQSTHPRGVRLSQAMSCKWAKGFNPRTRVGCDIPVLENHGGWKTFQSTHPRGVRLKVCVTYLLYPSEFQSTHPRGVRLPGVMKGLFSTDVSIHAPAWGATRPAPLPYWSRWKFQSTHPRGVRLVREGSLLCHCPVSIHAPAWGATPRRR